MAPVKISTFPRRSLASDATLNGPAAVRVRRYTVNGEVTVGNDDSVWIGEITLNLDRNY